MHVSRYASCTPSTHRATNALLQSRDIKFNMKSHLRRWSSSVTAQPSSISSQTIFSGIQPTGVPHLGNYLGALREWVRLQDNATEGTRLFYSIVDLHALTIPQDSCQLKKWRREAFATLLAVGLNPDRSTIFYQSAVRSNQLNPDALHSHPSAPIDYG